MNSIQIQIDHRNDLQRIHYEATVMIEDCIAGYYFLASMYNFSGDGMYCESDTFLKSSTAINVKVGNQRFRSAADRYSGTVRWCREIDSDDSTYRYGMGIKLY
jgi:hypothetical protein